MAEQPSEPDGSSRPSLPWVLFAVSTAVAVLATSGFVYLILKRTTGPVEVLHDFYQAVHNGDCETSWELLEPSARARTFEEWCGVVRDLDVPATFRTDAVTLIEDDVVRVHVVEPDGTRAWYVLTRGDESWRIVGISSPNIPGI
ncbi:MAG: hypothetical protein WD770_02155 [Actinomycetota bacterium]